VAVLQPHLKEPAMHDVIDLPQASAARTAPRVDLYAPIHKALRQFLCEILVQVGSMDPTDDADLQATLGRLDGLLSMMRSHVRHENAWVHPAIEARRQGGARRIAGEHDEHLASIDALQGESAALSAAPVSARPGMALRLYRHLALFVAENLQHMHVEEAAHNQLLWAAYSDAELMDVHNALLADVDPQEMTVVLHWMASSLSHPELAGMLGAMQAEMPPEPFANLLQLVQSRLNLPRWDKLARTLQVPQQPGLVDVR
jgi:hypothetical protein